MIMNINRNVTVNSSNVNMLIPHNSKWNVHGIMKKEEQIG